MKSGRIEAKCRTEQFHLVRKTLIRTNTCLLKILNEVTMTLKLKYEQNYNVIVKILTLFYLKQDVKILVD